MVTLVMLMLATSHVSATPKVEAEAQDSSTIACLTSLLG